MVGIEYRARFAGRVVREVAGCPGPVVDLLPQPRAVRSAKQHVDIAVIVDVGPQTRAVGSRRERVVGIGRETPVPDAEEQAVAAGPGGREVEYSVSIHVGGGDGRPHAAVDPFRRGEERSIGALRLRGGGSSGGQRERLGAHAAIAEGCGVRGRIVFEPLVVGEQGLGLFDAVRPPERLSACPIGAAQVRVQFQRAQKP